MSARPRRTVTKAAEIARSAVKAPEPPAAPLAARKRKQPSTAKPATENTDGADAQPKQRKRALKTLKPEKNTKTTASWTAPPIPTNPYVPSLLPPTLSFSLPQAIDHLSKADPRFGRMFQHVPIKPFSPPLQAIDPFRTLVTSIIGQQVSWMAARAINRRFRKLFGYGVDKDGEENKDKDEHGEEDEGFPSPAEVMGQDVPTLKGVGLSTRKAEYVISLAEHFCTGQLTSELLRDGTDEEVAAALIAVRGIGRWTVDMFLMFSLRRPDVLPVGDLGVQKGLLRWTLAAHGALPGSNGKGKNGSTPKKQKEGKAAEAARKKYAQTPSKTEIATTPGQVDELDTLIATPPPESRHVTKANTGLMTPVTPGNADQVDIKHGALHTPAAPSTRSLPQLPATPLSPALGSEPSQHPPNWTEKPEETLEIPAETLPSPVPVGDELLQPHSDATNAWDAHAAAPLLEGLGVDVLRSRLSGKKAKGGAYLTPDEMDRMTQHWSPYRSLAVYYMWPAGEEF